MNQHSIANKLLCLLTLLACGGPCVLGQVAAPSTTGSAVGAFVSFGGLRTHVINYTYNSLGVDGGIYYQPSPRRGLEARVGSYHLFARYAQMPVTGGYRMEIFQPRHHDWVFSGYGGGGMSKAQGATVHYVPLPAQWAPCWQASTTLTMRIGALRWRPYEATYFQTFTPQRTLSGYSLTTGIDFTFPAIDDF